MKTVFGLFIILAVAGLIVYSVMPGTWNRPSPEVKSRRSIHTIMAKVRKSSRLSSLPRPDRILD